MGGIVVFRLFKARPYSLLLEAEAAVAVAEWGGMCKKTVKLEAAAAVAGRRFRAQCPQGVVFPLLTISHQQAESSQGRLAFGSLYQAK
jgi:hypothetical protein